MFWQGNTAMSANTPVNGKWSKTVQKTSGSTNNAYLVNADSYNNKWYNSSTPYNQEFTLTWGGGSGSGNDGQLSTGATDGKYYTFQINNATYGNVQAVIMETSSSPVGFHASTPVAASSSSICTSSGTDQTITVTLAGSK